MKNFMRSLPGKLLLFVGTLLSGGVLIACVAGIFVMVESDVYNRPEEELQNEVVQTAAREELYGLVCDAEEQREGYRTETLPDEKREDTEDAQDTEGAEDIEDAQAWPLIYPDSDTSFRFMLVDTGGETAARSESVEDLDPDSEIWEYCWYMGVFQPREGADLYFMEGYSIHTYEDRLEAEAEMEEAGGTVYTVYAYLDGPGSLQFDTYARNRWLVHMLCAARYWILAVLAAAFTLTAAGFFGLMCAAGRRPGREEVIPGPLNQVPSDLLFGGILAGGCLWMLGGFRLVQSGWYRIDQMEKIIVVTVAAVVFYLVAGGLLLGLCMSFAVRIKEKSLLRNTLCTRCIRLVFRILKKSWKIFRWICSQCIRFMIRACGSLIRILCSAVNKVKAFLKRGAEALWSVVRALPLIRKTVAAFLLLCLIEIYIYLVFGDSYFTADYLTAFFFEKLLLGGALLYAVMNLRRLQEGGQALADGDLAYQVDTSRMLWDFKLHGENLNRIADGMTAAVEQRMKSERMKTELITNVSHDIKTPLTSIINYADLIGKEPCENEKIREYSEVLVRQSDRLKRLIEDLVEASKASTGNLEVILAPCDADIFLTQVSGEYELKLQECDLELIVSQPQHPVRVMADGRRMQRIFDNLMNNICKYAHPGTRVYLSLEETGGQVVITLKNTSHAPLNVGADELMERFVRGDVSRKTEGNGLGLSIARSLAELQGGTLELEIDGDLFKVTLRFPGIH